MAEQTITMTSLYGTMFSKSLNGYFVSKQSMVCIKVCVQKGILKNKQNEIRYVFKRATVHVCLQRLRPTHVRRIRQNAAQTNVTQVNNLHGRCVELL